MSIFDFYLCSSLSLYYLKPYLKLLFEFGLAVALSTLIVIIVLGTITIDDKKEYKLFYIYFL